MFSIPFRNLTIAACLALHVLTIPCIACLFGDKKKDSDGPGQVFAQSHGSVKTTSTSCSVCEAKAKIGKFYRIGPRVCYVQLPDTTVQKVLLLDDDTIAFGVATLQRHSIPSLDIHELRVLLE